MKALTVIAVFILGCPCNIYSASPDADKAQTAAPAKPMLRFSAYDGDPGTTDPKDLSFQVNHLDLRKTEFLKLGEVVTGTKFKLTKFEFKTRKNPQDGDENVSELTLTNTETKEAIVLVFGGR